MTTYASELTLIEVERQIGDKQTRTLGELLRLLASAKAARAAVIAEVPYVRPNKNAKGEQIYSGHPDWTEEANIHERSILAVQDVLKSVKWFGETVDDGQFD